MRTLVQPGPVQEPRILIVEATAGDDRRVHLPPGGDLLHGLRDALLSLGIGSAGVQLIAGTFDQMQYLTGGPDPSGQRVATYGPPTHLIGPVTLVSGNAILGMALDGTPLVHCHAVVVDAQGRLHGGHLPPGTSTLGASGAVAMVTPYDHGVFRVSFDIETNYPIFGPVKLEAA